MHSITTFVDILVLSRLFTLATVPWVSITSLGSWKRKKTVSLLFKQCIRDFKMLRSLLQGSQFEIKVCGRRFQVSCHWYISLVVSFHLIGMFSWKGREWKIYCCGLELSSQPQIWKIRVVVCQTTSKKCILKCVLRMKHDFISLFNQSFV